MNSESLAPVWGAARQQDVDNSGVDLRQVCATISCLINYEDHRIWPASLHQAADLVCGTARVYIQQLDKLWKDTTQLLNDVKNRNARVYETASSDTGSDNSSEYSREVVDKEELTGQNNSNDASESMEVESDDTHDVNEDSRHVSHIRSKSVQDTRSAMVSEEPIRGESTIRSLKRSNEDQDIVSTESPKRPRTRPDQECCQRFLKKKALKWLKLM